MKLLTYTRLIGVAVLIAFLVMLSIGIASVLRSSLTNYQDKINTCIKQVADNELFMRRTSIGERVAMGYIPYGDTSSFVTKSIHTLDTSFTVRINKNDPTAMAKLRQYFLKSILPLNITRVDSLLRHCLYKKCTQERDTYIEYLDLTNHRVLASTAHVGNLSDYLESEIDTLDILNTIGVKAYVKTPMGEILKPMIPRLTIVGILVIVILYCLYRLLRIIIRQYHQDQRRAQFLRNLAHELKRPITSALYTMGLASDILKQRQDESATKWLDRSNFHLNRLDLQVEQLQSFIHGEEGRLKFDKTPVAIRPVFEELKEKYEHNAKKTVQIMVDADENSELVTDEMHFWNIVENLMENSVKYSGNQVTIDLKAVRENGKVVISVRDNGWGIPKADIKRVFDTFYRVKAHDNMLAGPGNVKGFGLGLSYVKTVVRGLGGTVTINSQENSFTEVRIVF